MEIIRFYLKNLRNEEHFQLISEVKMLIESTGAEALGVDRLLPVLAALHDREGIAIRCIRKSEYTPEIVRADTHRVNACRALTLSVRRFDNSTDPRRQKAAGRIRLVIENYGSFLRKSYSEKSAIIHHIVHLIEKDYVDEAATLHLKPWVAELAAANRRFESLINRRITATATRENVNLRETRTEIDRVYAQIIDRINAGIIVNGSDGYTSFVNCINERIADYKNTLKQRKNRAKQTSPADFERLTDVPPARPSGESAESVHETY